MTPPEQHALRDWRPRFYTNDGVRGTRWPRAVPGVSVVRARALGSGAIPGDVGVPAVVSEALDALTGPLRTLRVGLAGSRPLPAARTLARDALPVLAARGWTPAAIATLTFDAARELLAAVPWPPDVRPESP